MKYFLIILLFPLPVFAWDNADTQREVAWQLVNVMDWQTTLDIKNHPNLWETNPIMGRHPTDAQINLYMGGMAIAHYYISKRLKPKYRKYWQYLTIFGSTSAVVNNYGAGLRINF